MYPFLSLDSLVFFARIDLSLSPYPLLTKIVVFPNALKLNLAYVFALSDFDDRRFRLFGGLASMGKLFLPTA
jgi:hypothetical protein